MSADEIWRTTLEEVRALRSQVDALIAAQGRAPVADDLISYDVAGELADVEKGTISKWSRPGGPLKRYGTSKRPLVSRGEVVAYLRSRAEKAAAAPVTPEDSAALMLNRKRKS